MNKERFFEYVFENVCKGLTGYFMEEELQLYRKQREDGTSSTLLGLCCTKKQFTAFLDFDVLYETYLTGTSADTIVDDVIQTGKMIANSMEDVNVNDMEGFEQVKDKIFLRLRSKERNYGPNKNIVKKELDLFIAEFYVKLEKIGERCIMYPVHEEHLEKWGKDCSVHSAPVTV